MCLPALAQSTNPLLTCSAAQVRATERYWFTGDKIAIDFGTSGSGYTITTNAATAANVYEGSTVVTDNHGVLQFWVGEGVVHNRNQEPMDNGTGITSAIEPAGYYSAVQGFVAFAATGVPGKYFVVTTTGLTTPTTTPGDLYYSVIDMTAHNGLGAVTSTKNVLVPGTTGLANEVLTAVPTSDGLGHWVITTEYGSNNLVAVRFDDNGPVGAPVTTALSQPIGGAFGSAYFNAQLNRLVLLSGARMSTGGTSHVFLLQFNATTGAATELASWPVPIAGAADPNAGASGVSRSAYAADFSPSGNYVYVSQIQPGRLWRYDVSSENSATIAASEEFVGATGASTSGGGHVRRGPDGAMWVANRDTPTTLTRIPYPDASTVAGTGFVEGNIALPAGALSSWGLPQTVAGCAPVAPSGGNLGSSQAVPTLGEWALMLLTLGLAGGGAAFGMRRKRG